MKFKKIAALLLVAAMSFGLVACGGGNDDDSDAAETTAAATDATDAEETDAADDAEAPGEFPDPDVRYPEIDPSDWAEYDALIKGIKSETDMAKRVDMMHDAEDMLMSTGAIIPIYYYNDVYMQKPYVENVYATAYGYKYFQKSTADGADSLRINLSSEPARLDPALNSSVDGACLAIAAFSGLYTYDENGELVPDLAAETEISDDMLTYTFTLEDDLKWSDGSPFTAEDFVYSWKRAAAAETAADYAYMLEGIKGYPDDLAVSASEDGKVLTVELSAPCAYFLDLCAFPTFFPVKQDVVEGAEGFKDADGNVKDAGAWATEAGFVGNGPYTLESWNHKESMTYVKNPNYHRADEVTMNQLDFMLSSDATAIYAAYQAGDLDFIDTIPSDEMANAQQSDEFYKIDQLGTYYANFNVNSPLFEGKTPAQANAMRRAFSYLIDRQFIVDTVAQADQEVADTFVPIGVVDGNGSEFKQNSDTYSYPVGTGYYDPQDINVEKAIELLKFAGFEFDGDMLAASNPISIEYLTNDMESHVSIAESMQQDFAMVGIDMTIQTVEWDVFLETRKAGQYDFARNGWLCDFNDPINMLEMWTSDSGNNDCQFGK